MIQSNRRFAAYFFKGWWKEQVPGFLCDNKRPTFSIGEQPDPPLFLS
jgi:hypothetical protein